VVRVRVRVRVRFGFGLDFGLLRGKKVKVDLNDETPSVVHGNVGRALSGSEGEEGLLLVLQINCQSLQCRTYSPIERAMRSLS
jgi:hypothetical protein